MQIHDLAKFSIVTLQKARLVKIDNFQMLKYPYIHTVFHSSDSIFTYFDAIFSNHKSEHINVCNIAKSFVFFSMPLPCKVAYIKLYVLAAAV